jgi:hypothetical protein
LINANNTATVSTEMEASRDIGGSHYKVDTVDAARMLAI